MQQHLEELMGRLERAKEDLLAALEAVPSQEFHWQQQGQSIRRHLEETADRFNFHFSYHLARALGLPPPPCIVPAQLGSPREAAIRLQIVHRRFTNLLHDLRPQDLARTVTIEGEGEVPLAALLEGAIEQYRRCQRQLEELRAAYRAATGAP